MTRTYTTPRMQVEILRSKKFRLIIAGLIALAIVPTTIYYEMSYNSVNGAAVQLISVKRSVTHGFFSSSISSVTYYVEAHVWSYATSIDTRVSNPTFSLIVNSYGVESARGGSGTFSPNGYLIYTLTFTTIDSTVAQAAGQSSSNSIKLGMDALLSAGWFSEQVTRGDSGTYTF